MLPQDALLERERRGAVAGVDDLAARAYREIREAIVNHAFQPGQQLQETFLAEWLGISRTPIRQALRRLQLEGLVASAATRGVVVAQVTVEEIAHAYLLLEVLEGLASRLAAERLTDDRAATIRSLLDQMDGATASNDAEEWATLDAQLHDAIRAAAANPKLSEVADLVYPTIERVRNTYLRDGSDPDRLAATAAGHRAMGEAVLARDAAKAEALARRVFADGGAANVRLLKHWIAPLRRSF